MKIGMVLMTPSAFGGAESALQYASEGFRSLGAETDVLAIESKTKSKQWSSQCAAFITRGLPDNYEDVEKILSDYDGLVLSDTYFEASKTLVEVLTKSDKIAKWVSARHWNSTSKTVFTRHAITEASPAWCGAYVSFWPSVEEAFPDVPWHRGVLPYLINDNLAGLTKTYDREYDFLLAGRTDPKKGVVTFVSALERLSLIDSRPFRARIAGTPTEIPGGPHIATIAKMLENWDWDLYRDIPKGESRWMKSNWVATKGRGVIEHTGAFGPSDLPAILGSAKTFVNTTSGKYAPEHLEYVTMEAMDAGCVVVAPNDWPDYAYDVRPVVIPVPEDSYRIKKGNRIIYTDVRPEAPDTTYASFGNVLKKSLDFFESDPASVQAKVDAMTHHNRSVLARNHHPSRAAKAYAEALGLDWRTA